MIARICAICISKCTNFERRASSFSSVVLPERVPIPSRSEPEPLGEPKFEEEAGRRYRHICSVAHTFHEKSWETTKLGCRHLDKTKPEKAREREKYRARSNRKWLEPNGYGQCLHTPSPRWCCALPHRWNAWVRVEEQHVVTMHTQSCVAKTVLESHQRILPSTRFAPQYVVLRRSCLCRRDGL